MKKTIIISNHITSGVLDCAWLDGSIEVNCSFETCEGFNEKSNYMLELLSAKKQSLSSYKLCEAKFRGNSVTFSGSVSHDTLAGYGYSPLDIDTFVISCRHLNESSFSPVMKAFSGLVWDVSARYTRAEDTALQMAEKSLNSQKLECDMSIGEKIKNKYIEEINVKLSELKKVDYLPLPYTWYYVEGISPVSNLSILKHALFLSSVVESNYSYGGYYMGVYENHFALACHIPENVNPFSTLFDVAQTINVVETGNKYAVIGILLDNDGQYFEKNLAISKK